MGLYVELQGRVIKALFNLVKTEPDYLRGMVKGYRGFPFVGLSEGDYRKMRHHGFREPSFKDWPWCTEMVKIILEQVDDSGTEIVIRNQLGMRLLGYGTTQTSEEHEKTASLGICFLRTPVVAQPGALKVGDTLATGERILSEPRCSDDGQILIHFSGGVHGTWLPVPARIPISLRPVENDAPPEGYMNGSCLA
jgi:hypothetical protein